MRESIKAVCVVTFMVAAVVAALAWFEDRPNEKTWLIRGTSSVVAMASIAGFLIIHLKKDKVPDLLGQQFSSYFERNGLCFVLSPVAINGVCLWRLFFQNRFERECTGRVAIRPVQFVGRAEKLAEFDFDCPGGAYGVVTTPVGLPVTLQGKIVKFDIGADVEYPHGKGKMLRFRDGMLLRSNSDFIDTFARTTTVLGLLGGMIIWHRPARLRVTLPSDVAIALRRDQRPTSEVLWEPGETLLELVDEPIP
jgi:hypothetical protein